MARIIQHDVLLSARTDEVYDALMDSARHAAFTGQPAEVSPEVGGAVTAHDGYVTARNLELVPGLRIVQGWRGQDWPEGAWSICRFELEDLAGGGTRLIFTQYGVPELIHDRIDAGWRSLYWAPLKQYFQGWPHGTSTTTDFEAQ